MAPQNNLHFSHPHALHHLKLDELRPFTCDACHENIITTQLFHVFPPCNYTLHTQCFNAPLHLQHPSHPIPTHSLNLIPNPSNPSCKSFNCDACGFNGDEFCYNCPHCHFDIHLRCANLPMSLLINEHHHALRLFFKSPYDNINIGFQCDICHGMNDNRLWSYYCQECDFGTHVGCAKKFNETTYSLSSIERDQQEELEAVIINQLQEELDAVRRNQQVQEAVEVQRIKDMFAARARRTTLASINGGYSSSDDGLI